MPSFHFACLRDPIPLPQRLRLLRAAKRVERVGSDAGAVLGPGVVPSQHLVVSSQSGLAKSERFGRLADEKPQAGQIVACAIGEWMLRAKRLSVYGQCAVE